MQRCPAPVAASLLFALLSPPAVAGAQPGGGPPPLPPLGGDLAGAPSASGTSGGGGSLQRQGVNRYATDDAASQVTSVTEFSDLRPTDWAYQALLNLVERYGCVAGYADGRFRGAQVMTRYEAAALLNACLDRISETTDELRRLMTVFARELAVLRGRVDGLEAQVGELQATAFSTTTRLQGLATMVIGANSYSGNARVRTAAAAISADLSPGNPPLLPGATWADNARALQGAMAFNYDLRLNLDTSFSGKDLLRTQLRAGNFAQSPFGQPVVGLNATEVGFEESCGSGVDCGDVVAINRLFYQVPIGSDFTATIGARVRQDDMLALLPGVYPADTVLDVFTYYGAPGVYSSNLGAGAGLWWRRGNWSLSTNYISANGDLGNPSLGGIGTNGSQQTGTVQLGYGSANLALAAAYTYSKGYGVYSGNATPAATLVSTSSDSASSLGFSGYLQPATPGLLPSLSFGWGMNTYRSSGSAQAMVDGISTNVTGNGEMSLSWYVGLQWPDAFIKDNTLGMAVGQPTFLTRVANDVFGNPDDGNYAWEWWYSVQLSDSIRVTPALYYLSAPEGLVQKNNSGSFSNLGALIKTSLRF